MRESEQPARPEVTLTASSAPTDSAVAEPAEHPSRRAALLLLLPLGLLLLALIRPAQEPLPPVPAAPPVLVLLPDQLSITQGGVLVVPVELRNPGPALRVQSAAAYAQPVVQDPRVQAPESVRAGAQRRFVVLVAPDCRLLQPMSPLGFSASVLVVVDRGSERVALDVDLTSAAAIRDAVAGLCRRS